MRVMEIMPSPVVTVPPDLPLDADAGRLVLERRVKSIPVLRGRRVVGIMARRDLLEVLTRGVPGVLEVRLDQEYSP